MCIIYFIIEIGLYKGAVMKNIENNEIQTQDTNSSKDTLRAYYKDAYMRERERFNSMFGTLDYYPPYEEPKEEIDIDEILADTVPKQKYKKAKRCIATFAVLTVVFLASTAFLALKHFSII